MALNPEQEQALTYAKEGKSFFLTGPGGSGKSYLLDRIYKETSDTKNTYITAMTGCAALLLGRKAKTLHSWAGIGLGREPVLNLITAIKKSARSKRRWTLTDILIVDEVSMMTPELLEKLDIIARAVRKHEVPMGGIQCIFVGDFFQLPPVNKGQEETQFVFESAIWKQIVPNTVELKQIIRQKDPIFQGILDEARYGRLTKDSVRILRTRQNLNWKGLEIRPTLLFSRKAAVDSVNATNLKALMGERHIYKATTIKEPIPSTEGLDIESEPVRWAIQKLDRDASYSPELILAKGAQVMLLTNLDFEHGLVNGSRGVVTGFQENDLKYPIVKFRSGAELAIVPATWACEEFDGISRQQIPLALAYAMTIHKAQGATLDCALIDIGPSTFECGQAYVALSRVRSLDSLYIWDLDESAFITHDKVHEFYKNLMS